jgi:hypothetical protein
MLVGRGAFGDPDIDGILNKLGCKGIFCIEMANEN